MRSNSGSGKSNTNNLDPTLKEHANADGLPGKEAHGGDVAPPNSDEAGKRQSPQSGPAAGDTPDSKQGDRR